MRTVRALLIASSCALFGCANDPAPVQEAPEAGSPAPVREAFAPPRAELPQELPEGTLAMEVLSWGTLAPDLGPNLAKLSRRTEPAMGELQESLRAQGLRLVRLEAQDVGALFELAPPSGAVRRRIILPGTRYEDVVEGVTVDEETAVDTALGVRRVGPGAARLALRTWSTPEADGAVRVRADVIGLIGTPRRDGRRELLTGTRQQRVSGRPIPGLRAHIAARTDEAWAIVAASPDEAWDASPARSPAPAVSPVDPALQGADVVAVGPRVEPLRTTGEALFARANPALALNEDDAQSRLVILLVGRAPERFTLFPEQAGGAQ